jgi:hypothetical protein
MMMTHVEFVSGYRAGRVRPVIDPKAAGRLVAARMLLPWLLLPVFGIAVALALIGHFIAGALVLAGGVLLRWLVLASGAGFVMQRSLADPAFYEEVCRAGVLRVDRT